MGNRPIKLRKSNWRERIDYDALERQKVKFPLLFCGFKLPFCLSLVLAYRVCITQMQNYTQKKPKLSKKSILHK